MLQHNPSIYDSSYLTSISPHTSHTAQPDQYSSTSLKRPVSPHRVPSSHTVPTLRPPSGRGTRRLPRLRPVHKLRTSRTSGATRLLSRKLPRMFIPSPSARKALGAMRCKGKMGIFRWCRHVGGSSAGRSDVRYSSERSRVLSYGGGSGSRIVIPDPSSRKALGAMRWRGKMDIPRWYLYVVEASAG